MVRPPSKKQKTSDNGSVVVFKSHNLTPDVRIKVFEQGFHVHSSVLKVHSAFFFKFLDSPEKPVAATAASTQFRYDYVSVVDEDGEGWGLEPVSMVSSSQAKVSLKRRLKSFEAECFQKVLSAMYTHAYNIVSFEQLECVTRIADYYRALPILSASLYRVLLHNEALLRDIYRKPLRFLIVAMKLRHPVLFREVLIHVVGGLIDNGSDPHEAWYDISEMDNALQLVIYRAHSRLCRVKMQTDDLIHDISVENGSVGDAVQNCRVCASTGDKVHGALFYRSLRNEVAESEISPPIVEALDLLLKSNLILRPLVAGKVVEGDDTYSGSEIYLYCTDVLDEELPWDTTQTDW